MEESNVVFETAATMENVEKIEYNDEYILKSLMEGKSREEIALELNHKNYRTIDMYMRRRGYTWDSNKQIYSKRINLDFKPNYDSPNCGKVQRIISLFDLKMEPAQIAKKVGMKNHRAMAEYMKSKGYIWSSEKHNYILLKGDLNSISFKNEESQNFDTHSENIDLREKHIEENNIENISKSYVEENYIENLSGDYIEKLEDLVPMLEMINNNKEKLAELLSINSSATIPRYMVGGITITKSLCMSYPLSELIKEFSKEKNMSQREIFEIATIEFLKKYGYENEIAALFS